jgi:hypothetical protein
MKTEFTESPYKRSWTDYDGYAHRRASDRPDGHSNVYVSVEGEGIVEQLYTRRNRPHEALRPIVKAELEKRGIKGTLRWSQYAGCTCPCSPGFLIIGGDKGRDFWITIKADKTDVETQPR